MKPLALLSLPLVLLVSPPRARADDGDLPMGHADRVAARLDAESNGAKRAPLELTAQLGARVDGDGLRDFSALLWAVLPLDRIFGLRPRVLAPRPAPPAEAAPAEVETPLPAVAAVLAPAEVRALLDAVHQHAGLSKEDKRLDDLASRARTAAALPELRVRVARITDESQSLSPTEYDPLRVTADARSTLWLEARATWRLDRLLFAEEELAVERIRRDVQDQRIKLTERVSALVGAWQRAAIEARRDEATEVERLLAAVRVAECRTALDALSGGWLTARKKPAAQPEPKAAAPRAEARPAGSGT